MSIIFILILISAMSSFVVLVNEQLSQSNDIVRHVEKTLQDFYETEFIVYYLLDFYRMHRDDILIPSSRVIELVFGGGQKKISALIQLAAEGDAILMKIVAHLDHPVSLRTEVSCYLLKKEDNSIVLKSYHIKRTH